MTRSSVPIRLLTDEDVRGQIVAGLRRRGFEVVDVRDVGLDNTPDPVILDWAAAERRIVITQDERSMTAAAYARVRRGLPLPGVIVASLRCPVGRALMDIEELAARAPERPLDDQVLFLPLDKAWRVGEEAAAWEAAVAPCPT